jgi:hypothetical protein
MLTGVEAETSFAAAKPRLLFSVYLVGLPNFHRSLKALSPSRTFGATGVSTRPY